MLVRLVEGLPKATTQQPEDYFVTNIDKGTKEINFLLQKRLIENGVVKQIMPIDLSGKKVELVFSNIVKKDAVLVDALSGTAKYVFDGTEFVGETENKTVLVHVIIYEKDGLGEVTTSNLVGSFNLTVKIYGFTV